jgi:hypothetical protein
MLRLETLVPPALIAAVAALAGCEELACGDGTLEMDGECVPADGVSPEAERCGAGTQYDLVSQECVPILPPTQCGANTVAETNEEGVTICVGTGDVGGCTGPIACPTPEPDKVAICGQLLDTGTGEPLVDPDGGSGALCDPEAPTPTGPCSLGLVLYDPLEFAADQQDAPPLDNEELVVDKCGRFRAKNVETTANTFYAVAVDDSTAGSADAYALTGVTFGMEPGEKRANIRGYGTLRTTDAAWTDSANDPFAGATFSEQGVYVGVHLYMGQPVEGVKITVGGTVKPDDDFYFADSDTGTVRSTIDPAAEATGPNGAGLVVRSGLVNHGATGGEPEGCQWPAALAAAIGGVVLVREIEAHVTGDPTTPCP